MKFNKKKERFVFFIDQDVRERFEELAIKDHRELGDLIRLALVIAEPTIEKRIKACEEVGNEKRM